MRYGTSPRDSRADRAWWPRAALTASGAALVGLALVLAACGPAAQPAPTTAPAAPVAPTLPAAKPTAAAPAAQPAEKPAPAAAKPKVPQEIIDGANREGQLRLYWTSTANDQWRQKFEDAFNEEYGVKVIITDTRGNDWARDTAKLVGEAVAGQKPAWDLMLTTEEHHNSLSHADLLGQYNFVELFGVPPESVLFQGGAYAFANQITLPAYNRDLVKGADVPKTWDDLLDPKWKDKIGVHVATHHWARLSQVWGDEKTTQFVTRLAALNPRLGTLADLEQKLELGEVQVLGTQNDTFIRVSRNRGAPAVWAEDLSPVIVPRVMVGPLKGGANPNAALLFAGFLNTERGQGLWEEFQGQSSIYVPGSGYWKLVQGKEAVVVTEEFMEKELGPRTAKYGQILGYR